LRRSHCQASSKCGRAHIHGADVAVAVLQQVQREGVGRVQAQAVAVVQRLDAHLYALQPLQYRLRVARLDLQFGRLLLGNQAFGGVVGKQASAVEHQHAVGAFGNRGVARAEQHRRAKPTAVVQFVPQATTAFEVGAVKRVVQQVQRGVLRQYRADAQHVALPVREFAQRRVHQFAQPQHLQHIDRAGERGRVAFEEVGGRGRAQGAPVGQVGHRREVGDLQHARPPARPRLQSAPAAGSCPRPKDRTARPARRVQW
jgi:hypothetical protein